MRCYDRAGGRAEGSFNAVQVATGKTDRRFGVAFVYLVTAPSSVPHPEASYNSAHLPITVTRTAVGQYLVDFAGLQKEPGKTENVQVTALSTFARTCNTTGWVNSATGLQVGVECRQGATLADTRFQVVVIE